MARKRHNKPGTEPATINNISLQTTEKVGKKISPTPKITFLSRLTPYIPGLILLLITIVIALLTNQDYGIAYDETLQRADGLLNYDYIFNDNKELLSSIDRHYGPAFELVLIFFEKLFNLSDSRDIFLFRHLATHIFFLISAFSLYVLAYRLFKNRFIASLGFIMLAFAPRIYAHSFFNTKDLPFLSMFVITLTFCQASFNKNRPVLFFILGMLCGFTTSIRIMGMALSIFILLFLLIDLIASLFNKEKPAKPLLNVLSFSFGLLLLMYFAWPYLWVHPISNFIESLNQFSHFPWNGSILVNGRFASGENISWTYFPIWFFVTNPEVWLIAGFGGIIWVSINFFKKPLVYFKNTRERNFVLYLMCFFAPILAVIILHSIIYNDWRHLYFVYPSFVLLGLYFIDKLAQTKYRAIVQSACILQVAFVGFFMVKNHPFQQIYFNNLVSHKDQYLHNNYEMEYWGGSYKQALDYLLALPSKTIKVNCCYKTALENNILLQPEEDRKRVQFTEIENADYFVTNFWNDYYSYLFNKIDYSISVLNSNILCVYQVKKDSVSQKLYRKAKIINFKKLQAIFPDDPDIYRRIGNAYFYNAQYDSAEIYAKHALTLSPDDVDLISNLAAIYAVERNFKTAIELYKTAIKLNPHNVASYTNTGLAYFYSDQLDSAIFYLKKAIQVDPGFNPSYEILANAYKSVGDLDSARTYEIFSKKNNPGFKL